MRREELLFSGVPSADDAGILRLHELTTRLSSAPDFESALQEVLEAAIELHHADFGNIQVVDDVTGDLRIVRQKGFDQEFLQYFSRADENAACGQAIRNGQRVIVEDTETDAGYVPHRGIAKKTGYRAVQSTLLRDSSGHIVGALSTHFRKPHRPSDEQLRLTDLYASHAGNVIAVHLAKEKLRRNEERYTFLLALSDRKRHLYDASAIKSASASMLGEFLGADCVGYAEMLSPSGLAMIEGEWRADRNADRSAGPPVHQLDPEFRQDLLQGRAVKIEAAESAQTFLGNEFRAGILAPVIEGGRLEGVLYILQNAPRAWRGDEVTLAREVAARIWTAIVRAYVETQLKTSERRLRTLVEGIPQLVWRASHSGDWTWASSQWVDYTGISAEKSQGLGWLSAVHEDDRDAALAAWAKAADKFAFDAEYRLKDAGARYRFFRTRATPVIDEHGNVLEWLGTSTDIDEMRKMQDHQQLLVAELQHRTRNLLAIVRSLGEQTFETSDSYGDFWENFAARIDAISRAQKLLSRSDDAPVTLPELLDTELAALTGVDKSGLRVSGGPEVPLPRETIQSLALALHELTTNAVKHGALGKGQVDIGWQVEADGGGEKHLQIDWAESGAEVRSGSPRRGFGRELIEDALPYQHEAVTEWRLLPEGLRCTIRLPISPRPRSSAL